MADALLSLAPSPSVANLVANPGIRGERRGRESFLLRQLADLQSHSRNFESLSLRQ